MLTILFAILLQTAHIYPDATWEAPGVVRLTWTAENDGLYCAYRRRESADLPLGCFDGHEGKNYRTLAGDYASGDILWVENEGRSLPLPAPRFVFLPGVLR